MSDDAKTMPVAEHGMTPESVPPPTWGRAIKYALGYQIPLSVLFFIFIDPHHAFGEIWQYYWCSLAAFWVSVIVLVLRRRPRSPTVFDEYYVLLGWWLVIPTTVFLMYPIWNARGVY